MGIEFNSTDIDRTKEVFFNGTSVDKVYFNGTEIWEQGLDDVTYTDSRQHCIDHFLYVKYDDNTRAIGSSLGNTNVTTYTHGGAFAPTISVTVTLSGG
jgi:hypothetical protein